MCGLRDEGFGVGTLQDKRQPQRNERKRDVSHETCGIAAVSLPADEGAQQRRDGEAAEGAQSAHPARGAAHRLRHFLRHEFEDRRVRHAHAERHDNFRRQRKPEGAREGQHQRAEQHDGQGEDGCAFAAESVGERAAPHAHERGQDGIGGSQYARRHRRGAEEGFPIGRQPGGHGEETAEGGEVNRGQRPGLPDFGGEEQAVFDISRRENFLPKFGGGWTRLFGRHSICTQLKVGRVESREVIADCAENQQAEPDEVRARQPRRGQRERQDEGEDARREVAHAAVDSQRAALLRFGRPIGSLADADRKRGNAAAAQRAEQENQRIHSRRQAVRVKTVNGQRQTQHAEDGETEQNQHGFASASHIHPGGKGDA